MTKQAALVIDECDFDLSKDQIRKLEMLLCKHTAAQVVSTVNSKDPGGDQSELEWFLPLFDDYIPQTMRVVVDFNERFWEAYDLLNGFVEQYDISMLPLVAEMSGDVSKLKAAMSKSKPHLKYVHKVWQGMPEQWVETTNLPEIEAHDVRTTELD